ncbi:RND family efflux transporter, MFP subunit [Desulfonatronum thiosulfatophilum]|uniref:RND family efflux transporter, MFP subunit n=1 Tax=Desulfonatronum thiosulfatophilum TaxID=617002 RepID=A0A1G6ETC5_9BACT|nr:efflux RND transporter periplasmic adaptor subunit [Desulfonatronum thiosulfatophilum]SDB60676.1 RND family efflux transporter, MFP subunit [Desulfonatronum thiosulfatophilum]
MSQKSRRVVLPIVLIIIAGLGWVIYQAIQPAPAPPGGPRQPGSQQVAVQTASVTQATVRDMRTFSGTLIPWAQFVVAPKISGRLERLFVDVGDLVQRDQLVAQLEDAEFVQQVEQARAELAVARANLEEARSELDIAEKEFARIETLREQRVASLAELELSKSRLLAQQARKRVAEAQIEQRQAALRAAEVRLSYTQIRATWPANGEDRPRVVGERFVDQGTTLTANAQMISVLDISALRAVFHVSERDYARLQVGQSAQVSVDAFPGQQFEGRVARIAPVFREASRQARIELELFNPEGLMKPGMFVRAQLELDRAEEAVVVPSVALVRRDGQHALFAVEDDATVRLTVVRVGISENGVSQILEPEDLSGEVVILGQHLLEDGSSVRVVED